MQQCNTKTSSASLLLFSDVHIVLPLACLSPWLTSARNVDLLCPLCQSGASHSQKEHRSAKHQSNPHIILGENNHSNPHIILGEKNNLYKLPSQCWQSCYLLTLAFESPALIVLFCSIPLALDLMKFSSNGQNKPQISSSAMYSNKENNGKVNCFVCLCQETVPILKPQVVACVGICKSTKFLQWCL